MDAVPLPRPSALRHHARPQNDLNQAGAQPKRLEL